MSEIISTSVGGLKLQGGKQELKELKERLSEIAEQKLQALVPGALD